MCRNLEQQVHIHVYNFTACVCNNTVFRNFIRLLNDNPEWIIIISEEWEKGKRKKGEKAGIEYKTIKRLKDKAWFIKWIL